MATAPSTSWNGKWSISKAVLSVTPSPIFRLPGSRTSPISRYPKSKAAASSRTISRPARILRHSRSSGAARRSRSIGTCPIPKIRSGCSTSRTTSLAACASTRMRPASASEVTQTAPVDSGTFTIKLPQAVSTNDVVLDGPGSTIPTDHTQDGRVWTWSVANMSSGDSLTARLEFPALVNATAPAWQQADDAQRIREQDRASRDALLKLLLAGAALLTLTAGGVGLFGLWYTRGRDPGVGAVASYLSEPPDDLPPGAAGALVDEEVNERDIVATLVDLGRRGVLNIQEEEEGSVFKRREYTIALKQDAKDLRPFEQTFVTSIMSGTDAGKTVTLGDAKERFSRKVETIRSQMYDELVKRGYFTVSPQTTRKRYQSFASVAIVALIIAAAIFGGAILDISGWFIVPAIAILVILFALYQTARYMPRKTVAGAESAAKWRAFKRYLEDIDQQKVGDKA